MRIEFIKRLWELDQIQDYWWDKWRVGHRIQCGNPNTIGVLVTPITALYETSTTTFVTLYPNKIREVHDVCEGFNPFLAKEYRWIPSIHDLWKMQACQVLKGDEVSNLIQLMGFDGSKHGRVWDWTIR